MTLTTRLKQARDTLGKTQKEIAAACSVSVQMWQKYEAGESVPGGKVLEELARLGININWLLTGEGPVAFSKEEIKRLSCEDAHRKLRERIKKLHPLSRFTDFFVDLQEKETAISETQLRSYIYDEMYVPTKMQLVELCKRVNFNDEEMLSLLCDDIYRDQHLKSHSNIHLSDKALELAYLIEKYAGTKIIKEIETKLLLVKAIVEEGSTE